MASDKTSWHGTLTSVQPRIRLGRSFDERTHTYQGYVLRITGQAGPDEREVLVAVGKKAHEKHEFQVGNIVKGLSSPVPDPRLETAEFYKTSGIAVLERGEAVSGSPPPWTGVPPALEIYRARGHRRLAARTYSTSCFSCQWGCLMPVEMIVDHWNPRPPRYRTEAFCYGPKSCPAYRAGPPRKVPGRNGMSWTEEDWIDEENTAHRGPDE